MNEENELLSYNNKRFEEGGTLTVQQLLRPVKNENKPHASTIWTYLASPQQLPHYTSSAKILPITAILIVPTVYRVRTPRDAFMEIYRREFAQAYILVVHSPPLGSENIAKDISTYWETKGKSACWSQQTAY